MDLQLDAGFLSRNQRESLVERMEALLASGDLCLICTEEIPPDHNRRRIMAYWSPGGTFENNSDLGIAHVTCAISRTDMETGRIDIDIKWDQRKCDCPTRVMSNRGCQCGGV